MMFMITFTLEQQTLNGIGIKVCGICEESAINERIMFYRNKIKNFLFPKTTDEYYLDFMLYRLLTESTPKFVYALGSSILNENIKECSGGIIGNPHSKKSSAENQLEYISNGLFCVAFSGKFGTVFKCKESHSVDIYRKLITLTQLPNIESTVLAEKILQETELYIFISDGSGKDSYFYVSSKSK